MSWTAPRTWVTSEVVTAAVMNTHVRDNLKSVEEINYTQFTSDVSITATSEGTAQQVVTSGAITYEAVPHLIEFWASRSLAGSGGAFRLGVFDGTTQIGLYWNASANEVITGLQVMRITPTAASHTYNIRGWNSAASTSTVQAGAGGTGAVRLPGFIRITRVPA